MDPLQAIKWLTDNPDFDEPPATIEEFLGDQYLNIEDQVRPAVREELVNMFGTEIDGERIAQVSEAIFTGAIGIGKTTLASIVLPYMVHYCLCLQDPQKHFNLLPGSRIAFMMMSTSESQAKEVLFGDVDARIKYSPWFRANWAKDPAFKNQIRFPKDIWILPGDSSETTFEGYNILGGIIDEIDSHKVTEDKDYAEVGYDTILGRIRSRFGKRGFLLLIGQAKRANGFALRKYNEYKDDPENHAARLTIWESFGWQKYLKPDGSRDSFWYDKKRKQIVPTMAVSVITNADLMEIPNEYKKNFMNDPEKALRDLAGIPPAVGDPFISLTYRIEEARDRWTKNYSELGSPVQPNVTRVFFEDWFKSTNSLKRAAHIDIAYSAEGDALGFAMGHVRGLVEIEGELKPYIVIDMLARMKAAPGTEIFLQEVRQGIIYYLKDDLGFNLKNITMDGFESTEMMQQLRKRRFWTDYLSVDKSKLPYYDLRDALYEARIEFPPYMTYLRPGGTEKVEILYKELTELEDLDRKIDHPTGGSKDVSDAVAGVVYTLMGDRTFRRSAKSTDWQPTASGAMMGSPDSGWGIPGAGGMALPGAATMPHITAPLPPSSLGNPFVPRRR